MVGFGGMSPLDAALALAAGYLAGSIPTGFLVARAKGVDITKAGSGNIGATNVARTLGKRFGALVLLVDASKGFVPVLLARRAWLDVEGGPLVVAGVGALAIVGHVFPLWLRLRGGKGVATGFGVFLALEPVAALLALALWASVVATFHIASVGSLLAATTIPFVVWLRDAPSPFVALALASWTLVVIRHRGNIRRLLRHEERNV